LLIGVKDNGAIAGIRSEEEYFMLEAAATMYCRPPVEFTFQEWLIQKKTILEVTVLRSPRRPHYAETQEKEWHAFVRVRDQNFPANRILLRVWKNENRTRGVFLHFTEAEKFLLSYLEHHPGITLSGFSRKAGISRNRAENILVKLLLLKIITMQYAENRTVYSLGKTEGDL
jgi:predicted HTH transcriptional regulator